MYAPGRGASSPSGGEHMPPPGEITAPRGAASPRCVVTAPAVHFAAPAVHFASPGGCPPIRHGKPAPRLHSGPLLKDGLRKARHGFHAGAPGGTFATPQRGSGEEREGPLARQAVDAEVLLVERQDAPDA